jgi:hypothetical protein
MKNTNKIKCLAILITTLIYLSFSFRIGYWLTGDIHNGGPLVGLFLTPLITLLMTLILFINHRQTREKTIIILTTFLFFILYSLVFNRLANYFSLKIYKEYYLIYEHSTLINSTKWILIILSTLITYLMTKRITTKKTTTP